ITLEVIFYPRGDFGSIPVRLKHMRGLGLRMDVGRGAYWLRSSTPLSTQNGKARVRVNLKKGELLQCSLSYSEVSPAVIPLLGDDAEERIQNSIAWWQRWVARCAYE